MNNIKNVKLVVNDLKHCLKFLSTILKFVSVGKFEFTKEQCNFFSINPTSDFSHTRLLLNTNAFVLNQDCEVDVVNLCLADINTLKSSLLVIFDVENNNNPTIELEISSDGSGYYVDQLIYKNDTKFKIRTVSEDTISRYVSKDLKEQIDVDWSFNINPNNWQIIMNKTENIISKESGSIYIYPQDGKVYCEIAKRTTDRCNSIGIPISNSFKGVLEEEIAVSDFSCRLFNLLNVNDQNKLNFIYNDRFKLVMINSSDDSGDYFIKSRFLSSLIKGK